VAYSSELGEWVNRASQLRLTGASHATPSEIAAVHAGIWPRAEAVRVTCPRCYGSAYFRILRWLGSQSTPSTSTPTTMAEATQTSPKKYQFHQDTTSYRPFGSPVVYSNANLTDTIAGRILTADPSAEKLFKVNESVEVPPVALTLAEQTAELDKLKRDELDALYLSEVADSDPKAFANKGDLIASLLQVRATLKK